MERFWLAERKNLSDDDTLAKLTDAKMFAEECVSVSVSIQVFLWPPSHCHKYSWRRNAAETQVKALNVVSLTDTQCVFLKYSFSFVSENANYQLDLL